jgi:hypothetical protein
MRWSITILSIFIMLFPGCAPSLYFVDPYPEENAAAKRNAVIRIDERSREHLVISKGFGSTSYGAETAASLNGERMLKFSHLASGSIFPFNPDRLSIKESSVKQVGENKYEANMTQTLRR